MVPRPPLPLPNSSITPVAEVTTAPGAGRRADARRTAPTRKMRWTVPLLLSQALLARAFAPPGNLLLLDHLNICHEKGRHDLVRAFYFDILGMKPDPRKMENLEKGRKTVWANGGISQWHLPEGDEAQVFEGSARLAYEGLDGVRARLERAPAVLDGTKFSWRPSGADDEALLVTCPWGNTFELVADGGARDTRGTQPGDATEVLAMSGLTVGVPAGANLEGIGRFYERVLGCEVCGRGDGSIQLRTSPTQVLTFAERQGVAVGSHAELVAEGEGTANYGIHVSVYLKDLRSAYRAADTLGLAWVNQRFKRKAYTEDEALEQCMFRILDVVDPDDPGAGAILQLEHEVRSAVKLDGSKYKSCPLDL